MGSRDFKGQTANKVKARELFWTEVRRRLWAKNVTAPKLLALAGPDAGDMITWAKLGENPTNMTLFEKDHWVWVKARKSALEYAAAEEREDALDAADFNILRKNVENAPLFFGKKSIDAYHFDFCGHITKRMAKIVSSVVDETCRVPFTIVGVGFSCNRESGIVTKTSRYKRHKVCQREQHEEVRALILLDLLNDIAAKTGGLQYKLRNIWCYIGGERTPMAYALYTKVPHTHSRIDTPHKFMRIDVDAESI